MFINTPKISKCACWSFELAESDTGDVMAEDHIPGNVLCRTIFTLHHAYSYQSIIFFKYLYITALYHCTFKMCL